MVRLSVWSVCLFSSEYFHKVFEACQFQRNSDAVVENILFIYAVAESVYNSLPRHCT